MVAPSAARCLFAGEECRRVDEITDLARLKRLRVRRAGTL